MFAFMCSSSVGIGAEAGASHGPIHWDPAVFQTPTIADAPGFAADGVKAIYYSGLPFHGKPTRVFAWLGLPKLEGGKKAPGIVLVHGGGGTAYDDWVRLWTARGYAAIAMDTCGGLPRDSSAISKRNEQGGPPGWGGFDTVDESPKDQWTYHAVADAVLADSLLRSLPEVDSERIGLTGISWGGYLSCIIAGVDHRLKFVVPVYGCGFLAEDSAWLTDFKKMGPERAARWTSMWDPCVYLKDATMPMLWVDGTNDFAYPLDSLQKSYRLPTGPRTLCMKVRMPHGHPPGQTPEEIRRLRGFNRWRRSTAGESQAAGPGWAERLGRCRIVRTAARAELNYSKDQGVWQNRKWETILATIDPSGKKVTATLPQGTKVYYLNLIDSRGLIVSTEHDELK